MSPQLQRVATSAFVHQKGRVLLLRRAAHETFLPGYYDLPGGKVDLGEAVEDAVKRELKEEAGLEGVVSGIYNTWGWTSDYQGTPTQFVSIGYAVAVPFDATVRLHRDFDQFVWASPSDLAKLLLTNELRQDLEKGFAWLSSGRIAPLNP